MTNADRIRDNVRSYVWAADALARLRGELDALPAEALAVPSEPGGWWHQYVCPTHHAELLFDPREADAHEFVCPRGCRLGGEPYRGAWLVFKHQSLARYALQAAVVRAGTREDGYARLGARLLRDYAAQFPRYPVHPDAQPWMLKGRAFHQALTEAIWATTIIRAYLLLRDEGAAPPDDDGVMATFFGMLEGSMEQYRHILIHEKKNAENNYTAWLNAALACVYAARGERGKLSALVDGEGGLIHHLSIGVKPDQLEFEGSAYYHIFVLRAYLIAAEMGERLGVDLFGVRGTDGQSFEGMFGALVALANRQGELPALHDGPYAREPYAREIAEICEIGLTRYGHAGFVPIAAEANRQLYGAPIRTGLEALAFGTGEWPAGRDAAAALETRRSLLLADSGFVALRRPGAKLSGLADFGPHGGSHGHFDKLHLSLVHERGAISPDLGVVPYGSALRKGWYAETASHNTVAIGGRSQAEHAGRCMKFVDGEDASYVWLRSEGAYNDTTLDRHVLLTDDGLLLDWFEARTGEAAAIDWWLHPLGTAAPFGDDPSRWVEEAEEASPLGETGGYVHVRPVRSRKPSAAEPATLLWRLGVCAPADGGAEAAAVTAAMWLPPGAEAKLVRTPGTPVDPSRPLAGIVHRQAGRHGRFITVYRDGEEPIALHWSGEAAGAERVDVRTPSGARAFRLVPGSGLTAEPV
ncbi:heparinase II/III domain-containing protein [Paenibacillus flagellatus]|uniref:Heparinase n=1 Tax=Paenibacillus flagellatus TaxID=2211139 RepID=A0A2V5KIL0_9BACL|nr:heparinase II/III family protein [Paenibacillus flagellatus]PYI54320.1 heparinase [Paenibacillus flagellatus]